MAEIPDGTAIITLHRTTAINVFAAISWRCPERSGTVEFTCSCCSIRCAASAFSWPARSCKDPLVTPRSGRRRSERISVRFRRTLSMSCKAAAAHNNRLVAMPAWAPAKTHQNASPPSSRQNYDTSRAPPPPHTHTHTHWHVRTPLGDCACSKFDCACSKFDAFMTWCCGCRRLCSKLQFTLTRRSLWEIMV